MLRPSAGETLRAWLLSALVVHGAVAGNPDAKRLYDDLLSNYNKLVRPVVNTSDVLRVCIKLKLSQLIDVFSPNAGISSEFSDERFLKKNNLLKNEWSIVSLWSDDEQIKEKPNKNEIEDDFLFFCPPCYKTFDGIDSDREKSYFSKDLKKKHEKMSEFDERKRKSKVNSYASEKSTRRKNSSSFPSLKSKRKNHKGNLPETLFGNFKNVDSMKEFKRMLENFRIVNDLNYTCGECQESKRLFPAYFVLKLAENTENNFLKGEDSHSETVQSFKLVFANDEVENSRERKPKDSFPSQAPLFVVKVKDELIQTNDESEAKNSMEGNKEISSKPKCCPHSVKMKEEFKFQREFISALLEQMNIMMTQLTIIIKSLKGSTETKYTDSVKEDDLTKECFFLDTLRIKELSNKVIMKHDFEAFSDSISDCSLHKKGDQLAKEAFNKARSSRKTLRNYNENISENLCTKISPRKHETEFFLNDSVKDQVEEKQLHTKIESSQLDEKCKCFCQVEQSYKKREKFLNSVKKSKKEYSAQLSPRTNKFVNELHEAFQDQRMKKKKLNKEGNYSDYEDSSDEIQNIWNDVKIGTGDVKIAVRIENAQSINEMKMLNQDAVRPGSEGTGSESIENDGLPCSNKDNANKLFTQSSSRLNLKNQIMTTNLWVEQSWYDYKLRWDPKEYGGVHMLHVPSDHIWRPDIVLYNNADGNFEVTLATKATIYHQGLVEWKPPAIYKSSCEIDVEYFPFDEQTCVLKFGSWTYDGFKYISTRKLSMGMTYTSPDGLMRWPRWTDVSELKNCADGNYEVTLMTKARVSHTGLVEWQPPAVYKSSCAIDVEFFPYDIQTCVLKLGSWTYDGFKVDLRHMDEKAGSNVVEVGVDLSEFYMSVEWDILEVPAVRNEKFYTCCDEPYLDITFNITMRRKTLFYTVNIIIPCMGISFLTVLTFYLPSDSGEKVTLSISILISLHVFFLLVVEIIPPTSLVVPLLGKYLIFAMILVSISICVTVVVLNVHFRSPQTHRMAPWVKRVFIHILPRLLVMRRPQYHFEPHRFMSRRVIMQTVKGKEIQTSYYPYPYQTSTPGENPKTRDVDSILTRQRTLSKEDFSPECLADGEPVFGGSCQIHGPPPQSESEELSLSGADGVNGGEDLKSPPIKNPAFSHSMCPPEVHKSCFCVRFIAEHTKMLEDSTKVKEDWKYVAMVLDRLFLWIFTLAVLVGTAGIILQAPTLYDDRIPIDKQFAEIQTSTVIRCPPQ